MRYWKLKESNRVIAVNCQMTPRWEEITKELFDELVKLRGKESEENN
jgi:hypothetical protein